MAVLVWMPGLRGPTPQRWDELPHKDYAGVMHRVLAQYPLPADEARMPLDQLAARYPAPAPVPR
ncbi:hypothetical protein [Azorhizobium doebereinerae]|uniref:hypothetical protein n=1 Tax=Azorhizobium doebereinerae TaxID=281091 RepID=UPI0012EB427F|nr:hypothetical protein [Azorhizobium doebereinerae]